MIAKLVDPRMNGALRCVFSERIAIVNVVKNAKAYGGTVSNCAWAAVYPRSRMMLGKNSERVYSGRDIVWKPKQ